MGINRPFLRGHITPADDFACRYSNILGVAAFDIILHESPRQLDRRRFEERQISPLPGDKIEGAMETFDMALRHRHNSDGIPVNLRQSDPPLAKWPENPYLGFTSPT